MSPVVHLRVPGGDAMTRPRLFADLRRWEGHAYRVNRTEARELVPGDEIRNGDSATSGDLYSVIVRRFPAGAGYRVRNISAKNVPDEYDIPSCLVRAVFLEERTHTADRFREAVGLEASGTVIRAIHDAWVAAGRPDDLAGFTVPPRGPYPLPRSTAQGVPW